MNDKFYNRVSGDRISSRQVDELIGLVRGIAADGTLNVMEVEFLQKWLAANLAISDQPIIRILYERINEVLVTVFSIRMNPRPYSKRSIAFLVGILNLAKF